MASKEKPVCRYCSSDSIVADAAAEWDNDHQQWIITSIYDKGHYCAYCESETSIDWVET